MWRARARVCVFCALACVLFKYSIVIHTIDQLNIQLNNPMLYYFRAFMLFNYCTFKCI